MLIIKQKPGNSFRIGPTVVTILGVQGNNVKIGIDAPQDLSIERLKRGGTPCFSPVS